MNSERESFEIILKPVRQLFCDYDSGYGIYACETDDKHLVKMNSYGNFTIKGATGRLSVGRKYTARLTEKIDEKYGVGYECSAIYEPIPKTKEAQIEFLRYVLTDNQVNEILKVHPNEDILELIEKDKLNYKEIKGIGDHVYKRIKERVQESKGYQEAFAFLGRAEVPQQLTKRIVRHFESTTLMKQKMTQNPYCITEISGIGFKTADPIALNMGIKANDPFRIQAAIEYIVEQEASNGHIYCTMDKATDEVNALIGVNHSAIAGQFANTKGIVIDGQRVALRKLYKAERETAKRIKEILEASTVIDVDVHKFLDDLEEDAEFNLSEEQRGFFDNAVKYNFQLLVGNAGSGKSSVINLLIQLIESLGMTYSMMSPTAKAAKVLAEYTNRYVQTIHRAIGVGLRKELEEQKVIGSEFVIVDETSMLDSNLCSKLLNKCVHPNVRVIFIGDNAQIPSVGAGNVLHDLINTPSIPKTILTQVFRQKEGGILDIATKTRKQEKFLKNKDEGIFNFGNNCTIVSVPQEKMEAGFVYYYKQLLDEYKPEDIMALSPTKKSDYGTVEINKYIQSVVNPGDHSKDEIVYGQEKVPYRQWDYIMNITNTYGIEDIMGNEKTIVNGDTGKIIKVDENDRSILVDFGFAEIPMKSSMLQQIMHSWCITLHKSQGSGSPAVIMLIDKSHKFSLNTNLLYTGITRAKEKLIIITQAETYNYALNKMANLQRNTFLREFLDEEKQVNF